MNTLHRTMTPSKSSIVRRYHGGGRRIFVSSLPLSSSSLGNLTKPTKFFKIHRARLTTSSKETAAVERPTVPSKQQLTRVFWQAAVPMVGFGIMDQTVMIQAGNAIDCTIGVVFGLSTLAAAAIGQICSDASGVIFGGTVERIVRAFGVLAQPVELTTAQRSLSVVTRTSFGGSLFGIVLGCTLGLANLLLIDTSRSSTLKLQASSQEGRDDYDVTLEASNQIRDDATVLTIQGPAADDDDGRVLASTTTALYHRNARIVEMNAGSNDGRTKVVFAVVDRAGGGTPFNDEDLEALATAVLEATRTRVSLPAAATSSETTITESNKATTAAATTTTRPQEKSFQGTVKTLKRRMTIARSGGSFDSEANPTGSLNRRITIVRQAKRQQTGGGKRKCDSGKDATSKP